jgi:hypothetical protein
VSTSEQGFPSSGARVSSEGTKAPEDAPFDPRAKNGSDVASGPGNRPAEASNGRPANGSPSENGSRPAPMPASISSQLSGPLPSGPRPSAASAAGGATQQMPPVTRPFAPGAPPSAPGSFAPPPVASGLGQPGDLAPHGQRGLPPQHQPGQQPLATQAGQQPRPAPAVQRASGPRKVRLSLAKVDPFSVLKLSFLVSVGIGIATVVAAIVIWQVLNGMGVFADVNRLAKQIAGESTPFDVNQYVGLGRVVSLATVIAVINVALLTALATLGAFLYNLASGLVGGLHVTLSDD